MHLHNHIAIFISVEMGYVMTVSHGNILLFTKITIFTVGCRHTAADERKSTEQCTDNKNPFMLINKYYKNKVGWGTNQNNWGTNGSNCGNAPLVCMLEMSSSEEQVQEGATLRYLDN